MPAATVTGSGQGFEVTSLITVIVVILVLWFVMKLVGAAIRLTLTVVGLAIVAAIVYFVLMR